MIFAPFSIKRCTKCKQWFPATVQFFYKSKGVKCGLMSQCKNCMSIQSVGRPLHPTETLPKGQKRCSKCKVVFPATTEYFTKNTRCFLGVNNICKSCQAVYYQTIKETYTAKQRKYRREHREETKQREQERAQRNPEKYKRSRNAATLRRRARQFNLLDQFSKSDWSQCLEYWHSCCAYCGNPPGLFKNMRLSADHFIPITAPDCPGTVPTNIVPACYSCNSSKCNRRPEEWIAFRFGKRKANRILAKIRVYFVSLERNP